MRVPSDTCGRVGSIKLTGGSVTTVTHTMPKLYKLFRSDLLHHGYIYRRGTNLLPDAFKAWKTAEGGFKIYPLSSVYERLNDESQSPVWANLAPRPAPLTWISVVEPDEGAQQFPYYDALKVDRLNVGYFYPIRQLLDGNEEHRREAIRQWGPSLGLINERLRSRELCELAVSQRCESLQHVPEVLKSEALCELAVCWEARNLRSVPEGLKSLRLCLLAVKTNTYAFEFVPEALRDFSIPENREICEIAVEGTGYNIRHVINASEGLKERAEAVQWRQYTDSRG